MTTAQHSPRRVEDGQPPGNELTALLWIIAVLLAILDTAWWFMNRLFSA